MFSYKKWFTLIEVVIVIVIIWLLASALIPRIQSAQAKARDTTRKNDMRNIIHALELHMADNANYPKSHPTSYNQNAYIYSNWVITSWLPNLKNYLSKIPLDPINTKTGTPWTTTSKVYTYAYWNVFNPQNTVANTPKVWTYDLIMNLENPKDPDRCEIKQYKYLNNQNLRCGTLPKTIRDYSPNVKNTP